MNFKQTLNVKRYLLYHHHGAANGDQPTVHKESQPVPGIKIESYILATFLNTMTFSGEIMQKSLKTYLTRIKGNNNLKRLEHMQLQVE